MSFTPSIWARSVKCKSGNDKSVLWAIVSRAQKKDNGFYEAFPGIDLIMEEACVSEKSVYNALNRLYAAGLITKISPDGNRKSNTYRLNVDAPNTEQRLDDARPTRNQNPGNRPEVYRPAGNTSEHQPSADRPEPASLRRQPGPGIIAGRDLANEPDSRRQASG